MPNEKLSLLIEGRTSGREEIERLEAIINRVLDNTEKGRRSIEDEAASVSKLALEVGALAVAAKEIANLGYAFYDLTKRTIEHRGAVETTVDVYRGARLTIAALTSETALWTTGATVGAGLIAEKLLAVSARYSELLKQQALLSAQSGREFGAVNTFGVASITRGQDLNFLARLDPGDVKRYVAELERIPDPIERGRKAVEYFGEDAEKVYGLLFSNLGRTVNQAEALSERLDGPTRQSIQRLRDDFDSFKNANPFTGLLESLRLLREEAAQGITIRVAAAFDGLRNFPNQLPGLGGDSSGGEAGPVISAEAPFGGLEPPTLSDFRRLLPSVVGSPRLPGSAPGGVASSGIVATANAARARFSNSLDGLRQQLSAAQQSLAANSSALGQGGVLAESAAVAVAQASSQIRILEARIKAIEDSERFQRVSGDIQAEIQKNRLSPANARLFDLTRQFPQFAGRLTEQFNPILVQEQQDAIARATAAARGAAQETERTDTAARAQQSQRTASFFSFGLRQNIAGDEELVRNLKESVSLIDKAQKQRIDDQIRVINLLTGPGGELDAINKITELRIRGAETEQERIDAVLDREEKIKALRDRRDSENKETGGRIFDALLSGGSGLAGYASSLLLGNARTIFSNGFGLLNQSLNLPLPGQKNADGSLNTFGQLFKGTIFGDDPLKSATDKNTAATNANTAALLSAAGAPSSTISTVLGAAGGALGLPSGVFQGASGGNPLILSLLGKSGAGAAATSGTLVFNELGDVETYIPPSSGLGTFGKTAVGLGAAAAGAFGVARGINQGGARGALTATASVAGAAAAILPLLSTTLKAAGPIGAIVSLGAGLLAGVLPNPKAAREGNISSTLDNARYSAPSSLNYSSTIYGATVDYNKFGALRPIIVNQNIDAIDAKSIIDRRGDLAEATRLAIQEAHALGDEIRGLTSTA